MKNHYAEKIIELLKTLEKECAASIENIAQSLKKTVDDGGLIYVFGAGHSSMITEEAFHRAGGLIPVYPVLHDFLSPHVSHKIAGKMERLTGVAEIIFNRCGARSGDMMFIASNSGINAVAIEMAIACKAAGVKTVALTSMKHSSSVVSRHASSKRLFEVCDHVLDNHGPSGDALVDFGEVKVAACSSIANSFLWHSILTTACQLWTDEGKKLPVYISANLPGGDEHNAKMEASYRSRIPML